MHERELRQSADRCLPVSPILRLRPVRSDRGRGQRRAFLRQPRFDDLGRGPA